MRFKLPKSKKQMLSLISNIILLFFFCSSVFWQVLCFLKNVSRKHYKKRAMLLSDTFHVHRSFQFIWFLSLSFLVIWMLLEIEV